jgi:hypothetical protein
MSPCVVMSSILLALTCEASNLLEHRNSLVPALLLPILVYAIMYAVQNSGLEKRGPIELLLVWLQGVSIKQTQVLIS